ncbi:hypothetical protein EG328_004346 [Venturia inaequalis]|uniref:Uncharacterized protein n=1 Tax=Venturia inaequalis TaxID=5025 RepID=A0A8H3Z678_VENIN|nr:hypothetical protein EG328_004346 [Venturia inaequalis]
MISAQEDDAPPHFSNKERTSFSLQNFLTAISRQNFLAASFFTRPNSITVHRKRFYRRNPPLPNSEREPLLSQSAPTRMTFTRQLSTLFGRLKPRTSSPLAAERWAKEKFANDLSDEFANRLMPERTRWEEVERHIDWAYYSQSPEDFFRESHDWEMESDWRSHHGSLARNNSGCLSLRPTFYLKNFDWNRGGRVGDGVWEEPRVEYWEKIEFVWQKDGLVTSKIVSRPCCAVDDDSD